jgi:hypothetical protein
MVTSAGLVIYQFCEAKSTLKKFLLPLSIIVKVYYINQLNPFKLTIDEMPGNHPGRFQTEAGETHGKKQ